MKRGVLFVCYGNSCRSIMAEALARHFFGESVRTASAGIHRLGHVAEDTLKALEEIDVPTEGLHSKGFDAIDFALFHIVVNLTSFPLRGYIPESAARKVIDCPVVDPYGEGLAVYRQSRDAIAKLVKEKLPLWLDATTDAPVDGQMKSTDAQ